MKKISAHCFLLLAIAILLNACSKQAKEADEKEIIETVETENLEEAYGCTHTTSLLSHRTWPATGLPRLFTIRGQEDFDQIVKGASCSPDIDFGRHTLLIGVKTLNTGYSGIAYHLRKITKGSRDSLALTITFRLNAAAVMSEATWHVLIPKALDQIPVKIHIEKE